MGERMSAHEERSAAKRQEFPPCPMKLTAATMTEIPTALATAFRELVAAASELERACFSVGDRGVEVSAPRVRRALDAVEAARR